MVKKCHPSKYAVIDGENITHGFRCAVHKVFARRFSTEELRDDQLRIHRKNAQKRAKKS